MNNEVKENICEKVCDKNTLETITDHFEKNPEPEKILASGIRTALIIISACVGLPFGVILALYLVNKLSEIIPKLINFL